MATTGQGDMCGICKQPLASAIRRATTERCNHGFCLKCISGHVALACPTCGKPFSEIYEVDHDGEHLQTIKYQTGCRS
jgi:hypothetical protein